jgi:hypothetical protein
MQQRLNQYQCFIRTTAINGTAKVVMHPWDSHQQRVMLDDCLFKKAAHDRKFLSFVNPLKKGSWISCRDQYDSLGYSYIAVHVVKNNEHNIVINIKPT